MTKKRCDWCKKKEGTSFWITGAWICNDCRKMADAMVNDVKEEKKNDGLEKWF